MVKQRSRSFVERVRDAFRRFGVRIQAWWEERNLVYIGSASGTIIKFDKDSDTVYLDADKKSEIPLVDYRFLKECKGIEHIRKVVFGSGFRIYIGAPYFDRDLKEFHDLSFSSMPDLKELVFKGGVDTIGPSFFSHNKNLTTVVFEKGCLIVRENAFRGCCNLRVVEGIKYSFVDPSAFLGTPLEEEFAS